MTRFFLPFPPSLNSLYPGKVRRHKSKQYETWIKEAGKLLSAQHITPVNGLVQVTYIFGRPRNKDGGISKAAMDVFNREKAVSDLLVAHKIIDDDSCISRGIVEWSDEFEGVDVEIAPYSKRR